MPQYVGMDSERHLGGRPKPRQHPAKSPDSVGASCFRLIHESRSGTERLAQADRHLAELKAHIVRQSLILRRTLAEGRRLLVAKSTLQALEGSLRIFQKRCEVILDQLKRPPSE